jgi:hypothetical protein
LQSLDLSQCPNLTSLEGLEGFGSLQKLNLKSCKVLLGIKPLSSCISLISLDISFCDLIGTLEPLQGCTNLERIDFSYCLGIWSAVKEWKSGSPNHPFSHLGHCNTLSRSIVFNGVVGPEKLFEKKNGVLAGAGWDNLQLEELISGKLIIVGAGHPWSGKVGVATSEYLRPWSGRLRIEIQEI